MTPGHPLRLSFLLWLALSGCSALPAQQNSFPLVAGLPGAELPENFEVQALIHISGRSQDENYLLAMSTAGGELRASILTPQGFPVYSVATPKGQLKVSGGIVKGSQLSPLVLIQYLEVIYLEDDSIQANLQTNWRWERHKDERHFHRKDARNNPSLTVHFEGQPPWYTAATVIDNANHLRLEIHTLEVGSALSQ